MSPEAILAYWEKREEAIKLEKEDPYRHGFELDTWKLADEQLTEVQAICNAVWTSAVKTAYQTAMDAQEI